eukprot:TRINITY_DN1686_c0_g1_i2.p1 TRINITY_DN1686_c0_g1~~TRINITY_DN1686_c0_g1_i2.p1  ORF type:complete len:225 (-),score=40.37 TRINITY_DN1686_c0_g1_i2:177-851(-)
MRIMYGPEKVCAFYGDSDDDDGQSITGKPHGWSCTTWKDAPSEWKGSDDCESGTNDALGLGITGVIATMPGAAFCMVLLCCSRHISSTSMARCVTIICALGFVAGTVFFIAAASAVGGKCDDFNNDITNGVVQANFTQIGFCDTHDAHLGTSLGLLIGALLAAAFSACGIVVAVFTYHHCEEVHAEDVCYSETRVLNPSQPVILYTETSVQPTISGNYGNYEQA